MDRSHRPLWLSLVASLLLPLAHAAPPPEADLGLLLIWVDACETGEETIGSATRELQALLDPLGVRVVAPTLAPGRSRETGGVFVILVPPSRLDRASRGWAVAGVVNMEPGPQTTIWAYPASVAATLGLRLEQRALWDRSDRVRFERVLAAVVLHELAHVLAGASHARDGLMSRRLRTHDALDSSLALDPALRRAFLAGVARLEAGARDSSAERIASGARGHR